LQPSQSCTLRVSNSIADTKRDSGYGQTLFIDASGVLSNFGSAPTGIPRVERFLVEAALADPNKGIKVVRFDRRRRAYRELSALERRQLRSDNDSMYFDIIRHLARQVAGNRGLTLLYFTINLLLRTYRFCRRMFVHLWAWRTRNINPETGTVLLSNSIVLGSVLTGAMEIKGRKAFICHDLIPVVRPELAIDLAHAGRFSKNVRQIIQSGATVLCTSDTSLAMLAALARDENILPGRVMQFPMPSILYERAKNSGRLSRIVGCEPFVIYCSTIEARKNHFLLAQVWQRAIEEGIKLPKLVCIGNWGWGIDDLAKYLRDRPMLSDQLVFTGPVSDDRLIEYYRGAIFGVMPSRIEGWGYCASECLDFGIPVIISTDPGLREATRGLMPAIEPDDCASWYAEIRRMSDDSTYRSSLCRRIENEYRPISSGSTWVQIKDLFHSTPRDWKSGETSEPVARPSLTVVISTLEQPGDVTRNVQGLAKQVQAICGELIIVTGAPDDFSPPPEGIRVHRIPEATVFDCRLAALTIAAADIVAMTEDHCIHSDNWCARILENFSGRPNLALLGGAVSNGSTRRLQDLMNYWMTFATFAPGQVTAKHPCIAQFIVRLSAIEVPQKPGELESSIIEKVRGIPNAIYIDPELKVRHDQSRGFWNTFVAHFHNGRATAGFSTRRVRAKDHSLWKSLYWSLSDSRAHLRSTAGAFRSGNKPISSIAGYLVLISPLVAAHAVGEFVGYHSGPGRSAHLLG
jgi:glycosyltransferase involved in cell wall biosynthesis